MSTFKSKQRQIPAYRAVVYPFDATGEEWDILVRPSADRLEECGGSWCNAVEERVLLLCPPAILNGMLYMGITADREI